MNVLSEDSSTSLELLCDWTRSIHDCRDAAFIKSTLTASATAHTLLGTSGIWMMWYHNGGFKRTMVTNLFNIEGSRIQPRPVIACFIKVAANILILLDHPQIPIWLRIAADQLFWVIGYFVSTVTYVTGKLYAMPVTVRQGMFAVYSNETVNGRTSKTGTRIFYPTFRHNNIFIAVGTLFTMVFGMCCGIASGILHGKGRRDAARVLESIQHFNWCLVLLSLAGIELYYGFKCSSILRAHVMAFNARLNVPQTSFGLGDLKSKSLPRYLAIMFQISALGATLVFLLMGSLCGLWAWDNTALRRAKNETEPHFMAVVWTCSTALVFFIKMVLIAIHFRRGKEREVHDSQAEPQSKPPDIAIKGFNSMKRRSRLIQPSVSSNQEAPTNVFGVAIVTSAEFQPEGESISLTIATENVDATGERERVNLSSDGDFAPGAEGTTAADTSGKVATSGSELQTQTRHSTTESIPSVPTNSSSLSEQLERARQVQEFQRLQSKHYSALRQIERMQALLRHKQQQLERLRELQVLQQELVEARQQLHHLQVFHGQHQPPQMVNLHRHDSQMNSERNTEDIHIHSDMLVIQQQVNFSIQQVCRQIEAYNLRE
ncbi:hypothetical protein BGZ72_003299 [Mortierella alpina]|nr:hypothetical protein BGZ72_003299 [Mortierella alpina]